MRISDWSSDVCSSDLIFSDLDIEFPSHQVITSNSLSAAKEVVLNSDGFAILSDLSFFHEKKRGLIVSAEIDQVVEPYWFHMVMRSDYVGSEMLIKFITAFHLVCEEWYVRRSEEHTSEL